MLSRKKQPMGSFCNKNMSKRYKQNCRTSTDGDFTCNKIFDGQGATVRATLTSTKYRVSPIVQGCLEIVYKLTVKIPLPKITHALISKYEEIFTANYCDPEEETIKGSFIGHNETMVRPKSSTSSKERKVGLPPQPRASQPKGNKDIRSIFYSEGNVKSTTKKANIDIIEIN